ncbi:MAG TPA: hypothetical protein VG204_16925 [Terriglobia bacterium]|nr:hypothetical protein [Terriglobia bacterium]
MDGADYVGKFIFETYILPAQERGDELIEMEVHKVSGDLNYQPSLIRGILGSMKFRNTYRLHLASTQGLPNGQPFAFTFRLKRKSPGPLN